MNEEIVAALKNARSVDQVAEAFEAGIQAAYRSHPRDGHAAALEVLNRPAPASAAEPADIKSTGQEEA